MPYKSEKIKLVGLQDRRRKLTDQQKEEIKYLRLTKGLSLLTLARQFGVSKKLILLITNEKSAEKSKQRIKEHWREYQACKKDRADIMREHRRYKQNLYLEGKLSDDKE